MASNQGSYYNSTLEEEKIQAKDNQSKKWLKIAAGVGAGALTAGVMVLPAALAWTFLHLPRRPHSRTPRSAHGISYHRLRLRSEDGVSISGWFIPSPEDIPTRGVVVICHGYWGNRGQMLTHLRFLHSAGYAAVMFDFRAHGWSGGKNTTFGITEPLDLRAAIDWVKANEELASLPLAAVSESMGAAVTLMTAAEDERIQAIVADSAFARFDGAIETRLSSLFGGQFATLVGPSTQRAGERILGRACINIAPVEAIGQISPRPILLMQGTADEVVPPRSLHELYAAADHAHTELWEIEGSKHVRGIYHHYEEYSERVLTFLDAALPQPPKSEDAP